MYKTKSNKIPDKPGQLSIHVRVSAACSLPISANGLEMKILFCRVPSDLQADVAFLFNCLSIYILYQGWCVKTGKITFKWGIFHGGSFPPLFCSQIGSWICTEQTAQHQSFALHGQSQAIHQRWELALVTIKAFSEYIKIEFGLDKGATAVFKGSKVEELKHLAGPQNDFSEFGHEHV